jgi:hypothetical protein
LVWVLRDGSGKDGYLDIAAQSDSIEGIRQCLDEARKRKSRPAREFFSEFEAKHGLSD